MIRMRAIVAATRGGRRGSTGPTLSRHRTLMVFLNLDAMPGMIDELSKLPMMIVLAGYAAVAAGLAVVYFQNRWTAGWPALITAVGWLSVIMGFIRIVFPMKIAAVMVKAAPRHPSFRPSSGPPSCSSAACRRSRRTGRE